MRRNPTLRAAVVAVAAIVLLSTADAAAFPRVCVIVDPVGPVIGCRHAEQAGRAPAPDGQETTAAGAPTLTATAPLVAPSTPSYVPNLLVVRFRAGTSPGARAAALAD